MPSTMNDDNSFILLYCNLLPAIIGRVRTHVPTAQNAPLTTATTPLQSRISSVYMHEYFTKLTSVHDDRQCKHCRFIRAYCVVACSASILLS